MLYTHAQSILDPTFQPGRRNYWKWDNYTKLSDATIDTLDDFATRLPTPPSDILVHQVGGAINDVAADATAYLTAARNS